MTGHPGTLRLPGSSWNPIQLAHAARRWLQLARTDLSAAECFVVFVGNPRSGTTLVRSLLNAHPSVVVANEVHVLKCISAGESWKSVLGRILDSERKFAANPVWTGYDYDVPATASGTSDVPPIRVIGDKKAGGTSKLIHQNPETVERLLQWSRLPVRFVHCVRHPFDVIATKTRRNGDSLNRNIVRYFQAEQAAETVRRQADSRGFHRLYQEDLIDDPGSVLKALLQYFDLDASADYVRACESVIYRKPNKSRSGLKWPPESVVETERQTRLTAHLHRYMTADQLLFDEESDPSDCWPNRAAA